MFDRSLALSGEELTGSLKAASREVADSPVSAGVRNIAELAAIAGVAVSTVSRALANKPGVRRQTRDRIEQLARQHGFCLNPNAQSLRAGKSVVRPLASPAPSCPSKGQPDPFTLRLLKTIFDHATRSGFDVSSRRVETEPPSGPKAEKTMPGEVLQSSYEGKSAGTSITIQIIVGQDGECDVGVDYLIELSTQKSSSVA